MPLRELENLFQDPLQRGYKKGQVIMYAGDELTHVYYVKKGYVKMYNINEDGDERILLIFKPRTAFPVFPGIITAETYKIKYFYEAMSNVEMLQVAKADFGEILEKDENAARLVLDYVTDMAGDLVRRLGLIENKDAKNKITYLLQYLIKVCSVELKPGRFKLLLKMTHQDVASMTGLTRETASTQIKVLEKEGILEQKKDGRLIINQQKADQ